MQDCPWQWKAEDDCKGSPGLRLAGGLRDCIHLDKKMLETKRVLAKEMLHEQAPKGGPVPGLLSAALSRQ